MSAQAELNKGGEGAVVPSIPDKWIIFGKNRVDVSTSYRDEGFMSVSNNFVTPGSWLQSSGVYNFLYDASNQYISPKDIYVTCGVQLSTTSGSLTPFPAGSLVALTPDFPANFISQGYVNWGGQTWEEKSTEIARSNMLYDYVNYSNDYAQSSKGQEDLFILDSAGPTVGQSQLFSNLLIVGQSSGAQFQLIAGTASSATGTMSLKYIPGTAYGSYSAPSVGEIVSMSYILPDQDPIPCQIVDNTTAITVGPIKMTVGANISGNNYYMTLTGTGLTASDVLQIYANGKLLTFYDVTAASTVVNTSVPLALSYQAAHSGSILMTFTPASGAMTVGDLIVPNYLDYMTTSQAIGFVKRQQLTDAGKTVNLRFNLSRAFRCLAGWDQMLIGQQLTINIQTSQSVVNGMVENWTGTQAYVWMNDFQIIVPYEVPTPFLADVLTKQLIEGARSEYSSFTVFTQRLQPSNAGTDNIIQSSNIMDDKPSFVAATFVPEIYINNSNQMFNQFCSIVPPSNMVGQPNPLVSATITYDGVIYPATIYGQNLSDLSREFDAFLSMAGRKNFQLMGAAINPQQFLNNLFTLVFDLRGHKKNFTPGAPIQVKFKFQNNFAYSMVCYLTYFGMRLSAFSAINGKMIYSQIANK